MTTHKPFDLPSLKKEFHEKLQRANSSEELEEIRVCYFGKKGMIQDLMGALRSAPKDQIPLLGKEINIFKEQLIKELEQKINSVQEKALSAALEKRKIRCNSSK